MVESDGMPRVLSTTVTRVVADENWRVFVTPEGLELVEIPRLAST